MNEQQGFNKDAAVEYISRFTQEDSIKQARVFTRDLYRDIVNAGVDEQTAARVLKNRLSQHVSGICGAENEVRTTIADVLHMVEVAAARGKDDLGRLLVKFAFKMRPEGSLLKDTGHPLDTDAAKTYIEGVIPRPVMQLFLVSVRGTVDGLEPFRSVPMLFGTDFTYLQERRNECNAILQAHKFEIGGSLFVDWNKVYADPRAKEVSLMVISEILMKISEMGLDHYQLIMENLQRKCERTTRRSLMERRINKDDIGQLFTALTDALRDINVTFS
ncbi:MAG: hypothetical protein ACNI27_00760 [Desulfovibrio sp.]